MVTLIAGLILFLGVHSVRIYAEGWRGRVIARLGPGPWKGLYSLLSIAGFAVLLIGFGQARHESVVLWSSPYWTHDVAGLFTLVAFVLVVAAYVPGNAIKARLHDPMILGVKSWAFGHLVADGTLAGTVLFASFLAWAVLDFRAARQRGHGTFATLMPVRSGRTGVTVVVGIIAWAVFAFWLHQRWIGVSPFGVQPFG
jgi:uncharacterized membrane protein